MAIHRVQVCFSVLQESSLRLDLRKDLMENQEPPGRLVTIPRSRSYSRMVNITKVTSKIIVVMDRASTTTQMETTTMENGKMIKESVGVAYSRKTDQSWMVSLSRTKRMAKLSMKTRTVMCSRQKLQTKRIALKKTRSPAAKEAIPSSKTKLTRFKLVLSWTVVSTG